MPLDDSDIFKAHIYRKIKSKNGRAEFTENWKELSHTCALANMSINDVFRYYTHVIRSRNGMGSSEKEIVFYYYCRITDCRNYNIIGFIDRYFKTGQIKKCKQYDLQ